MEAICCLVDNTEDFGTISQAICKCVKGTNVKAAGAGVKLMIHLIQCYGIAKFPLKELLGPFEKAVGSKNAAVRQLALSFYEECYKWIGGAIQPAVDKLNKPQQDELSKLFKKFDESGEGKQKPSRMTAAEEERKKEAEIDEI